MKKIKNFTGLEKIPKKLWLKCPRCKYVLYRKEAERTKKCSICGLKISKKLLLE